MKKIPLLIISMLLFSCYPRTSAVDIEKQSLESQINSKEQLTLEKQENRELITYKTEQQTAVNKVEENSKDSTASLSAEKKYTDTNEKSSKVLKTKTYYPDGQLASETELTESYSKIQSELAEQVSENIALSQRLKRSSDSSKALRSDNSILKNQLNEKLRKLTQLELDYQVISKSKIKNTATEGFPWWGVMLGVAITTLCFVVYTKVKSKLSIIN